jgi:hypothetical protein
VPIVLSASLGALVSLGVAPSPSVGATLSFRARRRWLSVVLEGRADLPSSKGYYGGSVSTNVLGGSLLACAHPFRGLYGCGVGFLASFGEQGSGYAPNGSGTALFFAAGARVGWEVGLGARLFLDLRVDGMLSPTANAVSVEGMPAYAMPVESGSAGVGLGTRFWGERGASVDDRRTPSDDRTTPTVDRTTPTVDRTTAVDDRTTAVDLEATAVGDRTSAVDLAATAVGDRTTAVGLEATAVGDRTSAIDLEATAVGDRTSAIDLEATAVGDRTTAVNDRTTFIGLETTAVDDRMTAVLTLFTQHEP